jgi:undecaprenyl-diphosphatase
VPWAEATMLEITLLGSGIVLMTMVAISALFLWLSDHRYSASLLLASTGGGLILNHFLKTGFGRERPQVFEWGEHVLSPSFPSGHAMSSVIAYGTVAYLAARLQEKHWARILTLFAAGLLIAVISVSRLYLGVHYPSDVAAGLLIGLAWAAFCMATLELIQLFGTRYRPTILEHEHPSPGHESTAEADPEPAKKSRRRKRSKARTE